MAGYLLKSKIERMAMTVAIAQAELSKDTTKVGAVLLRPNGMIGMTAYNGPPSALNDTKDKFERPQKYMYAAHAEENLITLSARYGNVTRDCVVVCTHYPCANCMRMMISAGIRGCVYGEGTFQALEEQRPFVEVMMRESGFKLYPYNPVG